jgi:bacillolysin
MKTITRNIKTCTLLFVICALTVFTCQKQLSKSTSGFTEIAEPIVSPGWLNFKQEAKVNPKTLFKDYAEAFHLLKGNEMIIQSEETDSLGMTLYRYAQFFKNIEVENAGYLVRAKAGLAISANGRLAYDFQPETIREPISEERAWAIAKARIPSERYFKGENLSDDLMDTSDAALQYRPKGVQMFVEDPRETGGERRLAWVFKVYAHPFDLSKQVYINAADGSIFKELPLFPNCETGSGPVTFRGTQSINTQKKGDRFYLTDDCNGNTLRAALLDDKGKIVDIFDDDNNWAGNNPSVVTSAWGLTAVYDYFRLIHNRIGYDGKNGNSSVFNDPKMRNNGHNATGGGGSIRIGLANAGDDNDDYNTLDIIGHEFTHSVIETSSKLSYDSTQESAALNESFCDIFGQMVEQEIEGVTQKEWVIGDNKGCTSPYICRDLMNPKAFNNPDTYNGNFWQSPAVSPHNNGSVQNRWFALLTDGGSGTNSELGTQYNVTGIGIVKARKIAYRNLTFYQSAFSNYFDARDGSIMAAQDLYGVNSKVVGEVIKAWCAVGLCPYTVPTKADIFDVPGGNPNPASPDNNNTFSGATPLGSLPAVIGGKYGWTPTKNPKLTINQLSIFPANDADFFNIRFPNVETLGGRCFQPGFTINFGTKVYARIYQNGKVYKSYINTETLSITLAESQAEDFVLEVRATFPGQILEYNLKMTFYLHFDNLCYQTSPPDKLKQIQDCPMCDAKILNGIEKVILEPFYREKEGVAVSDYYLYWNGDGAFEIPINMLEGNNLHVELIGEDGKTVATARMGGNTRRALMSTPRLPQGVYSLNFRGFGNGTEIEVVTPQR